MLEYVPGGDLFELLRHLGTFSFEQTQFYTGQLVLVFDYLHKKNILYRDLKPENVLLNKDGYLKLTDFGSAKRTKGKTYTLCGTPAYLPPEVLMGEGHSKASDWWTLGVLLYEMIVGDDPFADEDVMNMCRNIVGCHVDYPKDIKNRVKSLLKKIFVYDVSTRLGSNETGGNELYSHKFFRHLNWEALRNMQITPVYIPRIK
jgi:protein kinase X